MAGLLFDFEHMEEHRRTVLEVGASLARHLDELDTMVGKIAQSWSGEAHQNFQLTYAAWRQVAANIHADLGYLHQIVCVSQGNYANADTAVQAIWGGGAA